MRTVPEWRGKSDDTPIPLRVKDRILTRARGLCNCCGVMIFVSANFDHIQALVNGGDNCESNIQALCWWCHKTKTNADVADKAQVYAMRTKHLGLRPASKNPIPGGKKTKWKKTFYHGTVRR